MGKYLYIIVALLLSLLVTACDYLPPPGPQCVDAQEFGDVDTKSFTLSAQAVTWVDTGMSVDTGNSMNIDITSGSLALCGEEETEFNVNATQNSWQGSGIVVRSDDMLVVEAPEPDSSSPSGNSPSAQKFTRWPGGVDNWPSGATCNSTNAPECWYIEGRGLIAKFGGGTNWDDKTRLFPGASWNDTGFSNHNGLPIYIEDYNLGADSQEVLFMVFDSNDPGYYANNAGGYRVKIKKVGCYKTGGENAEFRIGNGGTIISLAGGGYVGAAWTSGQIQMRVLDTSATGGDDITPNNQGKYTGIISTYEQPSGISNAINWVVEGQLSTKIVDGVSQDVRYGGVRPKLEEARELVYRAMINTGFSRIITLLLTLYVAIYGILFMYGFIQQRQIDFIIRLVKVAIVLQLIQAGSWDFFNSYLFELFSEGTQYAIHVFSNAHLGSIPPYTPDTGINFGFLDTTIGMFFTQTTWIKIAALLFAGPFGWVFVLLILIGMYLYTVAVIGAIIAYLIALVAISLLIAVAPIFLSFMLFEKTNEMFKKWINSLLGFALQPVLIFTVLVIFNFFMYAILLRLFNFSACWECMCKVLDLICIFAWYKTEGNPSGCTGWFTYIPVSIVDIFMFLILAKMVEKFIAYAEKTANQLVGASSKISLHGMASGIRKEMFDTAVSAATAVVAVGAAAATGGASLAKGGAGAARGGAGGMMGGGGGGGGSLNLMGGGGEAGDKALGKADKGAEVAGKGLSAIDGALSEAATKEAGGAPKGDALKKGSKDIAATGVSEVAKTPGDAKDIGGATSGGGKPTIGGHRAPGAGGRPPIPNKPLPPTPGGGKPEK